MRTQFDDFKSMKLKQACKAIEDMTYSFVNPETDKPTFVPAKHYESILNKTVEIFIDERLKMEVLNTIYNQLEFIEKEYGDDFLKALICKEMKIKPNDMSTVQKIALQETFEFIQEQRSLGKKVDFHLLSQDIVNKFNEVVNNKELHASIFKNEPIEDNELSMEFEMKI